MSMLMLEQTLGARPVRSWTRIASLAGLGLIIAFALIGPLVLPDPAAQDLARYLQPPSVADPLGTDDYGRSVASRVAHATRVSLLLAAVCVTTALILGCVAGVLSAWFGG